MHKRVIAIIVLLFGSFLIRPCQAGDQIRIGIFDVDATPPVGSPLAYDPMTGAQGSLSCRGIVLVGNGKPIVLCAVDWIGISSGGQTEFRESLAKAVDTETNRVFVHALHQHDAPRCDFAADELLAQHGLENAGFNVKHARDVIDRASAAARQSLDRAQPVTSLGLGSGTVERVASNRRILGEDGKVKVTRYTATADPKVRAMPVGTIDPELKLIVFFNGDDAVAAMSYYATHPQSYYRTGLANTDFPGMARNTLQEETGIPHIHFNGAGGNIGAGKWNDGSKANRQILADRVADGMRLAWQSIKRHSIQASELDWNVESVALPVAPHLDEAELLTTVRDEDAPTDKRWYAAKNLVWLRRCQAGEKIDVFCLTLGKARVLHMPGELFVEYQLAAQKMQPSLFVAMAAYGDYAPGYIGTSIAYSQGGYETSPRASNVSPEVERVLTTAMRKLLAK